MARRTNLHGRINDLVVVADGDEDGAGGHLVDERHGALKGLEGSDVEVRMNEVHSSQCMC